MSDTNQVSATDVTVTPQVDVTSPEPLDTPSDATQDTTNEADAPQDDAITQDDEWPKKAVNALSRQKKQNNHLRAEMRAMQQQVQQMNAMLAQLQKPRMEQKGAPREADFENVMDFIKAQIEYSAGQANEAKTAESQKTIQEQIQAQQEAMKFAQRESEVMAQAQEMAKTIPDLADTIENAADELDYLPPQVVQMILYSENPSLVAYNLIKEGRIGSLANMHPQLAAAEIARAQSAKPQQRKASTAPKPMAASTGQGKGGSKKLEDMSSSELMKWVKS